MKKLAVSAMAWPAECEAEGRDLAFILGVDGIELPLKRIAIPTYNDVTVPAFQALLPTPINNDPFILMARLREVASQAWKWNKITPPVCVFGSPNVRNIVGEDGGDFFLRAILPAFEEYNVSFAFEPLPESAFGYSLLDVMHYIWSIQSPNLKLNVDTASLSAFGGSFLPKNFDDYPVAHVHISEPDLAPLGTTKKMEKLHPWFAGMLESYNGWISIEQKANPESWRNDLREAVELVKRIYL